MMNTHMPFMSQHNGETISLCCRKVNGFWKIHRQVAGEWIRLNTQRPDDATECSPTAEYVNGQWRISFIAGGAEGDRLFRLHQYVDGVVSVAKEPAYVGFVNHKMLVHGGREKLFTIEMADGVLKKVFECPDLEELFRVSYDPEFPHRLLISGRYNGRVSSWIYDLGSDRIFDVEADGVPAYKCAFFEGKCYYARQFGEGFEDREVVEAQEVKITHLSSNIFTVRWEGL